MDKLDSDKNNEKDSQNGIEYKSNLALKQEITQNLVPQENETGKSESPNFEDSDLSILFHFLQKTSEYKIKEIVPEIDYNANKVIYPALEKIGDSRFNQDFLEKLVVSSVNIIEKYVYSREVVCSEHPENFSLSLRLYCPKCMSNDIEKFQLLEHKVCGFISEITDFGKKTLKDVNECPSCKREIKNLNRELRVPGMWYKCNKCQNKFDNVLLKFNCRDSISDHSYGPIHHNHEVDMDTVELMNLYGYRVVRKISNEIDTLRLISNIKQVLSRFGFHCSEFADVKGKSGLEHKVEVYGKDKKNHTVVVVIKNSDAVIDDNEAKSLLVDILDISSSLTIFVAIPNISERILTVFSSHGITTITGSTESDIIEKLRDIPKQFVFSEEDSK